MARGPITMLQGTVLQLRTADEIDSIVAEQEVIMRRSRETFHDVEPCES